MAINRETGRDRARRISMDYFKRGSALERGKLWLTALAVLLALAWLGFRFAQGERGNSMFSRGHVAAVHAAWNQTCQACHVDFNPINRQNFLVAAGFKATANARCESCHSGTAHHENQKA